MTETISEIKNYLKKQKSKWDYIFHFFEEIDFITDPDIILQVANIVKLKHQELLKKNNKNKTLEVPAKQPAEQPTMDVFRAKNHTEPLRIKDNTKQCYRCKEVKPKSEFHKNKKNKDGCQAYCKTCQIEVTGKSNKKRNVLKQSRKEITSKIAMSKKGVYIPTYSITITASEIDSVLKVIKKDKPYTGTHNDFICSETGIKKWRVSAVLLYLHGMDRIKKDYESVGKVKYIIS